MSCSKYHYVKFLDEVEEITDSKTNDDQKKKNLIFSDSKMSSSNSELINSKTNDDQKKKILIFSDSKMSSSDSEIQFYDIIEKLNIEHDEALQRMLN